MATFSIDIHGVRMSEFKVTARNTRNNRTNWITLQFADDSITLFLANEADFKQMAAMFLVEPQEAKGQPDEINDGR
jgi:hypothetical protein